MSLICYGYWYELKHRKILQLWLFLHPVFADPNDLMSVAYATGHPEIIDEIIPKTSDEIQAERKKQLKSLEELYTNMTIVMNELETMKHDIRSNKANIHDTDNYIINALHEIQGNITELSNKVNNS